MDIGSLPADGGILLYKFFANFPRHKAIIPAAIFTGSQVDFG
jgi:hypothetical protein